MSINTGNRVSNWTKEVKTLRTGKPSLEVAPTTFAAVEFSAACYLFAVYSSGLLLSHGRPSEQFIKYLRVRQR